MAKFKLTNNGEGPIRINLCGRYGSIELAKGETLAIPNEPIIWYTSDEVLEYYEKIAASIPELSIDVVESDFISGADVKFITAENFYEDALNIGDAKVEEAVDLPWLQASFVIDSSLIEDKSDVTYTLKVDNDNIPGGTKTITTNVDFSTDTEKFHNGVYQATLGPKVNPSHDDFLGIDDPSKYKGIYVVTLSVTADEKTDTLDPIMVSYGL